MDIGKAALFICAGLLCFDQIKTSGDCNGNTFQCHDGGNGTSGVQCIPSSWTCDGTFDCDTCETCNLDETAALCCENGFWCSQSLKCINSSLVCDGTTDCGRGNEDEQECSDYGECNDGEFSCHNGSAGVGHKCIPSSWVCDSIMDCVGNGDETPDLCCRDGFWCSQTSKCLDSSKVCDGANDCGGGSNEDEQECSNEGDEDECSLGTHNCNIHATCTNLPAGFICTCDMGYTGDGTSTCSASMDTEPPEVMNCPSDITVNASGPTSISWIQPTTKDESNVTTLVKTHAPGDVFDFGTTTVMYLFVDKLNNIASCTFTVKVRQVSDSEPPKVLNCPSDMTVNAPKASPVSWIEPTTKNESGNVTTLVKTHSPMDLFEFGTTTVLYMFADQSNNIASCTFKVKVRQEDNQSPKVVQCPSDISVNSSGPTTVSWIEPSTGDDSEVTTLVKTHSSGDIFDFGSTTVMYLFADQSNNIASCTFTVKVRHVDTTKPIIISCPNNMVTQVDPGSLGTTVSWQEPMAEDSSGDVMLLVQTHVPGSFFAVGTTIVSYIFRDKSNNMEKCSFFVTVAGADNSEIDSIKSLSDKAASSSEGEGISIAALALCLLVIVFIIVIVILLLIIKKRSRDKGIHLDGLQLSAAS